jgi:MYXO-CTERM domain-containing protein
MKKVLIALVAVVCTVSAYGQGIVFNNNVSGQVIAPIFGPNPGDPTLAINGQTSFAVTNLGAPNPFPQGTTEYLGAPLTGRGYYAQLWGALDTGAPGHDGEILHPLMSGAGTNLILVFRTINRFYGAVQTVTPTAVVAGAVVNDYVVLQMRVWENRGETLRSWDAVINDADLTILRGESNPFRVQLVTGTRNLNGLESFNIHQIPEPSVIAMGVLGLGALVLLRRRKN